MTGPAEATADFAVIGAGPAALAFAAKVSGFGLKTVLVDEQLRPGGQILRQPPIAFQVENWLSSGVYRQPKIALAKLSSLPDVEFVGGVSVAGLIPHRTGFELWLTGFAAPRRLRARRLLVATGCYDMPAAFPGWTLPGVMTAGGVQAFLKSQQFLPGRRFALCGTHPLQLILADQLVRAGAHVEAVIFAQPARAVLCVLEHGATALRNAPKLAQAAAALARLKRAGVPVRFHRVPVQALGDQEVDGLEIERLDLPSDPTSRERLTCDAVALCFGFMPQSDLPRSVDAAFAWAEPYGGWRILHDEWMRSSVTGLYVAGEVTGVGGADISLAEGALAGLGALLDEGKMTLRQAEAAAGRLRRHHRRWGSFADMLRALTSPEAALARMTSPETIVCRCENVRLDALQEARRIHVGVGRSSSVKLLTRAGMGPCQGRNCEHVLVRLTVEGRAPEPQDAFTARFPTRSAPIAHLL